MPFRRLLRPRFAVPFLLASGIASHPAAANAQSSEREEWVVPARRARRLNPVASSPAVIRAGLEIYRRECESCHGKAGRGDGEKAAELKTSVGDLASAEVQAESDGALFWKITEGRGDMPTNQNTLADDERWTVIHYVRTLALDHRR